VEFGLLRREQRDLNEHVLASGVLDHLLETAEIGCVRDVKMPGLLMIEL
jgi:hypothetical protein